MTERESYPEHPHRVLASSLHLGLAALVRLAKRIVTSDETVQSNLAGIEKMWEEVQDRLHGQRDAGVKDLTPLFNAEPNLRKNYLQMVWHSTIPFGNKEFRRVYRWSQGTIGPLNALLNFGGAQLRTLAMTRFPFPRPSFFQVRKHLSGETQTLPQVVALKHPVLKGVKTQWIAIYSGSRGHPNVRVRHPTLPELDFVDMIRAHVVELCRQCFIHNAPRDVSHQKIRLLIHRLTPFLEWKYTEGEHGKTGFATRADHELRGIVAELRATYSRRIGKTTRPSQRDSMDDRPYSITVDLFEEQCIDALQRDPSPEMKQTVEGIRTHIKRKRVTDTDVKDLVEEVLRLTSIEGNRWHRVLGNKGYQPNSLAEVVFYGDKHHRERSDIIITHEVPVATPSGHGKADIVVFVRHSTIWVPVMILDIKTKTSIDWSLFGKEPRTEKPDTRVPLFNLVKRRLSDSEWDSVLKSTPTKTNIRQLEAYRRGLLREFRKLVTHKELIPKTLWTGIVVLDSEQSYDDVVHTLHWLIRNVLRNLRETEEEDVRTVCYFQSVNDKVKAPRLALFLSSKRGPRNLLRGSVPLSEVIVEDPFSQRVKDDCNFTLYLTVDSPVSSGTSAAWMARNWHMLHYLQELGDTHILWIDLMGLFPSKKAALTRFRLTSALSPKGMKRRVMEKTRRLVESIEFVDLGQECKALSDKDPSSALNRIQTRLSAVLSREKTQTVVINGWADRRGLVSSEIVSILEERLLDWLPRNNVEIIWLDRPIPLPTRSLTYQRPEVSPLPHDSPRRALVDMIIWNKPVMPRFTGWESPMLEYVRVIEKDTPTRVELASSLFTDPHLHGWGRRFRAESSENRALKERDVMDLVQGPKYARGKVSPRDHSFSFNDSEIEQKILTESGKISPSLLRPRTIQNRESLELLFKTTPPQGLETVKKKLEPTVSSRGVIDRMTLVPSGTPPRRSRWGDDDTKAYHPVSDITRGIVRKEPKEKERRESWTRRPPLVRETPITKIDTQQVRKAEVLRLLRTARFLMQTVIKQTYDDRYVLLKRIVNLCKGCETKEGGTSDPGEVLYHVRDELKDHKESRFFWWSLSRLREDSMHSPSLSTLVVDTIEEISKTRPDFMTLYGNDMYLLILTLHWKNEDVSMSHLEILWKAFAEWQFVHMGFEPRDSVEQQMSKYDVRAMWSNLQWRTKRLLDSSQPVLESRRLGLMVHLGEGTNGVIFEDRPSSAGMLVGIFESQMDRVFERGWHGCKVSPFELDGVCNHQWREVSQVIITRTKGVDVLWKVQRDEDSRICGWWPEGVFTFGPPPEGKSAPVRWYRLDSIPRTVREVLKEPGLDVDEQNLRLWAEGALRRLEDISKGVRHVVCRVLLDTSKETYVVQFCEVDEQVDRVTIHDSVELEGTMDVIQTLRYPLVSGAPYRGEFWWDPRRDVEYLEVATESGPIDMTFLAPFVYRSMRWSEFLKGLDIPRTARDILKTTLGKTITLVADSDVNRYKGPMSKVWNVMFLQAPVSENIVALRRIDLDIIEVAEFFESQQVFDTATGLRHPTMITMNRTEEVEFPSEVFNFTRTLEYLVLKKNILPRRNKQ
jgi:hypothetical protein